MEFTFGFYKELCAQEEKAQTTNVIFSPLSVDLAMGMAAAGAGGETLEQMNSVIKGSPVIKSLLDSAREPDIEAPTCVVRVKMMLKSLLALLGFVRTPVLCIANGVWVEQSINLRKEYKQMLEDKYGVLPSPVDFINDAENCRQRVNSWVAERTNSKIHELLPVGSVGSLTRFVITNAIYFKAPWAVPLDPTDTKDALFHLPSGDTKLVPMMRSWKKRYIKNHGSFKVLCLPYRNSFSMYILLPSETQGLPALISNLDVVMNKTDSSSIPLSEVGVFQLPKFKISQEIHVPELLKRMGLELPFSQDHADFSGMTASCDRLYISNVFHKAFVEVEEGGTEATAATATTMSLTMSCSSPDPYEDFVADHPFLFLIREDETGMILFAGHVNDPTDN